jgi:hypothetical protein
VIARGASQALFALAVGCMSPAPSPTQPAPPADARGGSGDPMKDKLRAAAHEAATHPAGHPGFTLSYTRGHALSGTTQFTMTAGGTYSLESNVTQGRKPFRASGELSAAQRDDLLALVDANDVIGTPPSTRNIGDDEEPVVIEVGDGGQTYRLMIWHGDAIRHAGFHAFERGLLALVHQLSGGAVLSSPDY